MRNRIGRDRRELLEISRARRGVFFFYALLVGDGLLLDEFNVQRPAMLIVEIKRAGRRLAADDAAQEAAQLDRVMNAEIKSKPAERIVDVRGIAGEKHTALA